MRVGKRTDYNKITLEIVTDGSITPEEAFKKAVEFWLNNSQFWVELKLLKKRKKMKKEAEPIQEKETADEEVADPLKIKIVDLKIFQREH
jgi:DNA-directed RNA polymerase subunit alpha